MHDLPYLLIRFIPSRAALLCHSVIIEPQILITQIVFQPGDYAYKVQHHQMYIRWERLTEIRRLRHTAELGQQLPTWGITAAIWIHCSIDFEHPIVGLVSQSAGCEIKLVWGWVAHCEPPCLLDLIIDRKTPLIAYRPDMQDTSATKYLIRWRNKVCHSAGIPFHII